MERGAGRGGGGAERGETDRREGRKSTVPDNGGQRLTADPN
jgi:hypothetical protein